MIINYETLYPNLENLLLSLRIYCVTQSSKYAYISEDCDALYLPKAKSMNNAG